MSESRNSGLLSGLIVGAAVGAGIVFLFGTKRGGEIRKKVRDDYPEFFDKIDDVVSEAKDELSEKYDVVADKVKEISEQVTQNSGEAGQVIMEKVNSLGIAMESLGEQIQRVSSSNSRRFKRGDKKL